MFCYTSQLKSKNTNFKEIILSFALCQLAHKFLWFQGAQLDHMWVKSSVVVVSLRTGVFSPIGHVRYINMALRLSGQNCKFLKFLLSLNSQKRLGYKENNTKYRSLSWKPRSHTRILIYRAWPIGKCNWVGRFNKWLWLIRWLVMVNMLVG